MWMKLHAQGENNEIISVTVNMNNVDFIAPIAGAVGTNVYFFGGRGVPVTESVEDIENKLPVDNAKMVAAFPRPS